MRAEFIYKLSSKLNLVIAFLVDLNDTPSSSFESIAEKLKETANFESDSSESKDCATLKQNGNYKHGWHGILTIYCLVTHAFCLKFIIEN